MGAPLPIAAYLSVVGKAVGITGATWLLSKFTRAELDDELSWVDVIGLSLLAGIGFTVSLLVGELAFGHESDRTQDGLLDLRQTLRLRIIPWCSRTFPSNT